MVKRGRLKRPGRLAKARVVVMMRDDLAAGGWWVMRRRRRQEMAGKGWARAGEADCPDEARRGDDEGDDDDDR